MTAQRHGSSRRRKQTGQGGFDESGFALVISLSLLSLVVLVMVLLTTGLGISARENLLSRQHTLARQNALTGLAIALATLQRQAGPDQRVSAPAEATGIDLSDAPGRGWTAIWDTNAPAAAPRWLVSGVNPNPLNPANPVVLHRGPDDTAETAVTAPQEALRAGAAMAWWVSDEGAKATVFSRAPAWDEVEEDWVENARSPADLEQIPQMVPKGHRPDVLLPASITNPFLPFEGFTLEGFGLFKGLDREQTARLFPALTTRSIRVLANTLPETDPNHGLMRDLSIHPAPLGPAFEAYMDMEQHMEEPLEDPASVTADSFRPWLSDLRRRHFMRIEVSGNGVDQPSFEIAPVLTDFYLLFGINRASSNDRNRVPSVGARPTSEIVVRHSLHVEMWNPYSAALVAEELSIEITGLPDVTLTTRGNETRLIPLQSLLGNPSQTETPLVIRLPFEETGFPGTDDRSWLPGRVYSWTGPNNYSNGSPKTFDTPEAGIFYNKTLTDAIWVTPTGQAYPSPFTTTHGRFGLSTASTTSLTITLKNANGDVIKTFEDFEFDDFQIGPDTISNQSTAYSFGFRLRIFEAGDVASDEAFERGTWLRQDDPRIPAPGLHTAAGMEIEELYFPPNGLTPSDYTSTGVNNLDFLFDRTMGGTGKNFMEDIPLFELPRQSPLSVGEMQHLRFPDQRPNAVGNPWGGTLNAFFDQFFFSGASAAALIPNDAEVERLPHPRLFPGPGGEVLRNSDLAARAADGLSSRHLLLEGGFNFNSLSVAAWQAVLASTALRDWRHVNLDGANAGFGADRINLGEMNWGQPYFTKDLAAFFPRFPQSLQEVYQIGAKRLSSGSSGAAIEPPTEFFRQGLTEMEGDLVEDLAEAIVARMREAFADMRRPFVSFEEWLTQTFFPDPNGGQWTVIERAIADLSISPDPDRNLNRRVVIDPAVGQPSVQDVWHLSPNFLTQADFITPIASIAGPRSDTFLIRAAGSEAGPFQNAGEGARAYAEATVQRVVEPVISTEDVDQPSPESWGRRFVVVNFRWIDPPGGVSP